MLGNGHAQHFATHAHNVHVNLLGVLDEFADDNRLERSKENKLGYK
jgi:hypothetical protein